MRIFYEKINCSMIDAIPTSKNCFDIGMLIVQSKSRWLAGLLLIPFKSIVNTNTETVLMMLTIAISIHSLKSILWLTHTFLNNFTVTLLLFFSIFATDRRSIST